MRLSQMFARRASSPALLTAGLVACLSVPATAQFTYPGCDSLQTSNFQTVELFNKSGANSALATHATLDEPVQFDVQGVMNSAGDSALYTNIYFVERKGRVKFYNGLTKTVDSIGFIPNWAHQSSNNANDNGLMGIVLDPNFNTNRWAYFWYCPRIPGAAATNASSSQNRRLRLSRITINPLNRLDMSTEKIMVDILGSKTDQYHAGGPMTFDRNGDLWVTVGNNSNDLSGSGNQYSTTDSTNSGEWGSSSTASLRGGVFRIHPDNNATAVHTNRSGTYGPGYTIPAGNFGEYWADQFQSQGNTALAMQYRDTAKVRPEVYIKGTRSNYSISIHPTKRWIGWGDVQYQGTNDEFNLTANPAFAGMPYFQKNNQATPAGSITLPVGHSAATPINNSPLNSGVSILPPAMSPVLWYTGSGTTTTTMPNNVAVSGPIYVYDRNLKSSVKFPPHLNNSWVLLTVYGSPVNGAMYLTKLDSVTPTIATPPVLQATAGTIRFNIRNPIQAKYGPEGALYTLMYGSTGAYGSGNNPGLIKTSYAGTCQLGPTAVKPGRDLARVNPDGLGVMLRGNSLLICEAGVHTFTLHDMSGRLLTRETGRQGAVYALSTLRETLGLKAGVYAAQVETDRGTFLRNISLF